MYATATVGHQPMPDEIKCRMAPLDSVAVSLPDLYLSFTPDEAERLALALTRTAAEVRAAVKVREEAAA